MGHCCRFTKVSKIYGLTIDCINNKLMFSERSFNDIPMEQFKLTADMETMQTKIKSVMMLGAKINQVNRNKLGES